MLLGGLQKTTLIDYPGKIACTVFTVGCNFRCPFCHNKDLVTKRLFRESAIKPISQKDFFDFLEKRKKILDGVCITGGEPTICIDLPVFISKIKKLGPVRNASHSDAGGFAVKLDTNGSNPEMLRKLIKVRLIEYIAMDIKSNFDDYFKVINLKTRAAGKAFGDARQNSKLKTTTQNLKLLNKIKNSIKLIIKSNLPHEFRTTVVPGLHTKENLIKLAKQLKSLNTKYKILNTNFNWYLQPFRPQNCLDPAFLKIKPFSQKELKEILQAVRQILPETKMRGLE